MSEIEKVGFKYTEAGLIPTDWDAVLLDSVAKRGSGHTPDKKHPEYWGGSIKWVSLQDSAQLDNVYIKDTAATITMEGIRNSSAVLHPKGTVVLSRDAGVGKSAITSEEMAVSQHFMAWACGPRLNNHYLYFWLQSRKSDFERIANGNTIKTIGLPYFKDLKIPLPGTREQERIATALTDVDTLITGLDQIIAKKRDFQQAAMQQLLTGQRRLPGFSGAWEVKCLGEICTLEMGSTPSRANSSYWGGGHKWLSIGDLKGKCITTSHEEVTPLAAKSMRLVPKGTLLMSFKLSIGRLAFAGCDLFTNEAICSFNELKAHADFLYYALKRVDFSLYGKQAVKGYTLNKASLKTVEIELPTLEEQIAIAEVLSEMDTELTAIEARREKVHQLKQGMMQKLLTGRMRLLTA